MVIHGTLGINAHVLGFICRFVTVMFVSSSLLTSMNCLRTFGDVTNGGFSSDMDRSNVVVGRRDEPSSRTMVIVPLSSFEKPLCDSVTDSSAVDVPLVGDTVTHAGSCAVTTLHGPAAMTQWRDTVVSYGL